MHLLSLLSRSKGVEILKMPIDCCSSEEIDNDSDESNIEVESPWQMRIKLKIPY